MGHFPSRISSLDYASYSDEYVLGLPIFFWGGGYSVTLSLTLQEMIQFFLHSSRNTLAPASLRMQNPCQKKICTYPDEEVHRVFVVHTVDGSEILHNRRPRKMMG